MTALTNRQARQFMLLKHGLIGGRIYAGKRGALDFVNKTGCLQYDPVDVCGRNADIILNSRVEGYAKGMLDELLYADRLLIDYFDKNLSIFAVEDIPALYNEKLGGGYAEAYEIRGGEAVRRVEPLIRRLITERGHISAQEVEITETIEWHWSIMASLPRAALESMYYRGELLIHHKNGTNKSYAFLRDHVPVETLAAAPPYKNKEERAAWHAKRRIGAVGMLWNKAGDAWLGLGMKAAEREAAFRHLIDGGEIIGVSVEGIKDPLYIRAEDAGVLDKVLSGAEHAPRCEFIAPLDSFIWDRKLIKALFGFEYTWEIYTPAVKRKYGAYVLPILYGEKFVGRAELIADRKTNTLVVKNIWREDGVKSTKKMQAAFEGCLKRFAAFNGCGGMAGATGAAGESFVL